MLGHLNFWQDQSSLLRLIHLFHLFHFFQDSYGHFAPPYRANVVAANFPEFAAAFNCEQSSYMNPDDRCAIWWTLSYHFYQERFLMTKNKRLPIEMIFPFFESSDASTSWSPNSTGCCQQHTAGHWARALFHLTLWLDKNRVAETCWPCRPVGAIFFWLVLIFGQSMKKTMLLVY